VARAAVEEMHRTKVPASVSIAQAILESGWGTSPLAKNANNYFGIKGKGPAGRYRHLTWEEKQVNGKTKIVHVYAWFKKYETPRQSFADHADHFAKSPYPQYQKAMRRTDDARAFVRTIAKLYATDSGYARKLISLMNRLDLYRYDRVPVTTKVLTS
jgi:flagellum-specific peptidoglycan hydrolase FlgJ